MTSFNRRRHAVLSFVTVGCLLFLGESALAQIPPYSSPRALGMGNALRGAATGDAGPMLNPSGISLIRSYVAEAAYLHAIEGEAHNAHVSIVDSTSGFNLGGGIYYTYLNASPQRGLELSGHEAGASLSFPLSEYLTMGGTLKYFRLEASAPGSPSAKTKGLTTDVGVTIRPSQRIALGVVGYNLVDRNSARAPVGAGAGLTLVLIDDFIIGVDGVMDFTVNDPARGKVLSLMAGGEYTFDKRFVFRVGGGRRGDSENGYFSGGVSLLSEAGALDVAVVQDVSGNGKETFLAGSVRLFVPSP